MSNFASSPRFPTLAGLVQPEPKPAVPRHLDYPSIPAWGLLARAAHLTPDRAAYHYYDQTATFKQVDRDAARMCSLLRRLGVRHGDRVGVLLPNVPEYLVALNGIWRAGGVAVAISPLLVQEEVTGLLAKTRCRTVIALDILTGLVSDPAVRPEHLLFVSIREHLPVWQQAGYLWARWQRTGGLRMPENESAQRLSTALKNEDPDPGPAHVHVWEEPAYILPTGGTTGDPRAVMLSHRNLVANAWQQYHWGGALTGEETLLAVLPFFHSYGLSTTLLGGSAMAATLIMHHRFNPRRVLALIEKHRPTVLHVVPAMLSAFNERLRHYRTDLSSVKWVISGGASLSEEIAEEFGRYCNAIVVEGYGLSEASPVTHVGPLDGTGRPGTIGIPLPDTDCRIVDPSDPSRDMPVGEVGELLVRGPQVMLGYWQDRQATAQAVRDGWLHTGDLATVDGDGFYRIVDRKKDLIITSGFNVYPAEVEQVLRNCPLVADAAVVGVPDAQRGELVKAYIVLKPGKEWSEPVLQAYCRQHLAAHRRPRAFEWVKGDLPRNFLGKVLRRELRDGTWTDDNGSPLPSSVDKEIPR